MLENRGNIFVLCGNARQYEIFKDVSNIKDTIYVSGINSILGCINGILLCCGTYFARKDCDEIIGYAKNHDIEVRKYEFPQNNNM